MKTSRILKRELNTVASLNDLISSLEELSAMRYRKTKSNVLNTREYLMKSTIYISRLRIITKELLKLVVRILKRLGLDNHPKVLFTFFYQPTEVFLEMSSIEILKTLGIM